MRIQLYIKRFPSISSASVDLENPTFVVGCNGCGKSNLADAFSFLAELAVSPLQAAFDRRGGIHSVVTQIPEPFPNFAARVRAKQEDSIGLAICFTDANRTSGQFKSIRYAFEVTPLSRFEFEVVREQGVVLLHNGTSQYFDRKGTKVESNVEWMRVVENWGAGSALLASHAEIDSPVCERCRLSPIVLNEQGQIYHERPSTYLCHLNSAKHRPVALVPANASDVGGVCPRG